jgi:hypothetical protein
MDTETAGTIMTGTITDITMAMIMTVIMTMTAVINFYISELI